MLGAPHDDVCLVIDMECFRVDGNQHCRELGYCSWMGDSGRVAIHPRKPFHRLTRDEKKQVHFLTREIHGLAYATSQGEPATASVKNAVQRLYAELSRNIDDGSLSR